MVSFRPDLVLPNDPAGFGLWRIGHYNEHRQFIQVGLSVKPQIIIPDYDFLTWSDDPVFVRVFLDTHNRVHQLLDAPAGISSIDWSAVDFTDPAQFDIWQQDHAVEHSELRAAYGVT